MNSGPTVLTPRILIVGGGPAGLTAATVLAPQVDGEVLVLDRETAAGGIPRHSDHLGYGLRDLKRVQSGPRYARELVDRAAAAGATIRTQALVTGWSAERALDVTTPQGRLQISADAIILATGARERPRPARLIPGSRPKGVYTTGHLQNVVHLQHGKVGRRAVVVGAELVSWSAVVTLREAGATTVLMVSQYESPESYGAFNVAGRALFRTPIATRSRVVGINGSGRVESVDIEDITSGRRRTVKCDTVILTGDWIPDNELARTAGLEIDAGSLGPIVDAALRTSKAGVFAAGNLLHPVDTADIAALDGKHVAAAVLEQLRGVQPSTETVPIVAGPPLRWVSPGLLRRGDAAPSRHRLLCWTDEPVRFPRVVVRQDGRVLHRRRVPWPASPGRVFRIPSSVLDGVRYDRGPVKIGLDS